MTSISRVVREPRSELLFDSGGSVGGGNCAVEPCMDHDAFEAVLLLVEAHDGVFPGGSGRVLQHNLVNEGCNNLDLVADGLGSRGIIIFVYHTHQD